MRPGPRNRPNTLWKAAEDALILRHQRNGETWDAIASKINRTAKGAQMRFYDLVPESERNGYETRNLFSSAQDLVILRLKDIENRSFRYIGRQLGRISGSVRDRYEVLSFSQSNVHHETKRSAASHQFSRFEDSEIIRLMQQHHVHSRDIARHLGRTARSVRPRYRYHLSDTPLNRKFPTPRNLYSKVEDAHL